LGKVALASGDSTYKLDPYGDDLIAFTVAENDVNQLHATDGTPLGVENTGTIKAEGGVVLLSATQLDGIVSSVVNNGGTVSAASAEVKGGKIIFRGEGANVDVVSNGTVTASSDASDGGVVRMVADGKVTVSGTVEATGATRGGQVDVSGRKETVIAGARISTEGKEGGLVRLGGEFQGRKEKMGTDAAMKRNFVERFGPLDTLAETARLTVDSASAISAGSDGTLITWSGGETKLAGELTTRYLETSGKTLTVSVDPIFKNVGIWLIDPIDLTISNSGENNISANNINAAWLGNYIKTITTSPPTSLAFFTLHLSADEIINVNANIEYRSTIQNLTLGLALSANKIVMKNINIQGDTLSLSAFDTINIDGVSIENSGNIELSANFIRFWGDRIISDKGNIFINSEKIDFFGILIESKGQNSEIAFSISDEIICIGLSIRASSGHIGFTGKYKADGYSYDATNHIFIVASEIIGNGVEIHGKQIDLASNSMNSVDITCNHYDDVFGGGRTYKGNDNDGNLLFNYDNPTIFLDGPVEVNAQDVTSSNIQQFIMRNHTPSVTDFTITISSAATSGLTSFTFSNSGQIVYTGATDAINLNVNDLKNAMTAVSSANYIVSSTGALTLADSIQLINTAAYNFTLQAAGDVTLDGGIGLAMGNVGLVSTAGSITVNGNLAALDGLVVMNANDNLTINGNVTYSSTSAPATARSLVNAKQVNIASGVQILGKNRSLEIVAEAVDIGAQAKIDLTPHLDTKLSIDSQDLHIGAGAVLRASGQVNVTGDTLSLDAAEIVSQGSDIYLEGRRISLATGAHLEAENGIMAVVGESMTVGAGSKSRPTMQSATTVSFLNSGSDAPLIDLYPYAVKTAAFDYGHVILAEQQNGDSYEPHIFGLDAGLFSGSEANRKYKGLSYKDWPFASVLLAAEDTNLLWPRDAWIADNGDIKDKILAADAAAKNAASLAVAAQRAADNAYTLAEQAKTAAETATTEAERTAAQTLIANAKRAADNAATQAAAAKTAAQKATNQASAIGYTPGYNTAGQAEETANQAASKAASARALANSIQLPPPVEEKPTPPPYEPEPPLPEPPSKENPVLPEPPEEDTSA
jgi:hypothetical protein